jgi:hypothetical protein
MHVHRLVSLLALAACAGDPTAIQIELSPSVISSLDGSTTVSAIISDDSMTPLADVVARITVDYVDRNGTVHDIAPIDVRTDDRGVIHARLEGLLWDGTGTVTVETTAQVADSATFSVLDRTPPKIEILPPTVDGLVGPGLPLDVQIHVTDEIGVSQVTLDGNDTIFGTRTTVVASGSLDSTLTFRTNVPADASPGPTIRLNALATDLSGNIAAAAVVTLTVDPSITIATPPGLTGELLADGTATQLVDPRAVVVSAKDGHLYVADRAQVGACDPSCIWRVDATTGVVDPTPVLVGIGELEGVAVDATSDNLFYTDRASRVGRLTWNGTAYVDPVLCDDVALQRPQDPFHIVVDATLGLLVPDDNTDQLIRLATCATSTAGTNLTTNANFDAPHGIALGAAGEIFVSDTSRDRVELVDRTTGAVTAFETGIEEPYGMEWLGGASPYSNSLLVASLAERIVVSTKGGDPVGVTFLRNSAIDVALDGGTLYVVTSPGFGNRGRIYKVTGF